jgi:hypothetical protein
MSRASALSAALVVVLVAGVAAAGISLRTTPSGATVGPEHGEVVFGRLASGSSVGLNATNASASVNGALITTTTNLWYLNNTNASAPYFARIVLTSTPGISDVTSLKLGIDNGTASVDQVTATLSTFTKTDGAWVRLEPGATVRIYATHLVGLTFGTANLPLEVYVADDTTPTAYYTMRATLSMT